MPEEKRIGRYIIKGILGEGAMGTVFQGYDPNLERPVAVKTMRTQNIQKEKELKEFKERFFQESRVSGRLNHPQIVAVYDSGLHGSEPFLVMEFIDGPPLDNFISANYNESLHQYVRLLEQVASGLDYAHEEGVIHRDIKPGNILVCAPRPDRFSAKIVDFGLAKLKDSKLTMTGSFLGTPSYASPEQIINGRVDARSDIYSFGTVAYEMLTGQLPFEAESLHSILYQIAHEPPNIQLEMFAKSLDTNALDQVFQTVFEKDPEKRYQSAGDFVDALRDLLKPLSKMDRPPETKARRKGKGKARVSPDTTQSRKQKLIAQARSQFQQAYRTRNLGSVRYCLQELVHLGADASEEIQQVKLLEREIREEEERRRQRNLHRLIEKARSEFDIAIHAKNTQSARYCIKELEELGADTAKETKRLERLEREISKRAKDAAKEKLRQQLIEETRTQFNKLLRKKDLEGCKRRLTELRELHVDVKEETRKLGVLEERRKKDRARRELWIQDSRDQFQKALEGRQIDRCQYLIQELETLLKVDVSEEKAALEALKQQLKQASGQEKQIRQLRADFETAMASGSIRQCEELLKKLKAHHVDVSEEKARLREMHRRLSDQEAEALKRNMIRHTRAKFSEAIEKRHIEGGRYYLNELRQLVKNVAKEKRALAELEKDMRQQEAARLQEKMEEHLRESLRAAAAAENLDSCGYYLSELKQLGVDIETESKLVAELEKKQRAEEALHGQMVEQARAEFQKGLSLGDPGKCEHFLRMLRELGADVSAESKALAQLENEILTQKSLSSSEQAEEKLKQRIVEHYRFEFLAAFKTQEIDACRYYLDELRQLGAEVEAEIEAIHLLELKLQQL